MKEIVYDLKLKKFFVCILIIMIIFPVIIPSVVYAKTDTKTYEEWTDMGVTMKGLVSSNTIRYMSDNVFDWIGDENEREQKAKNFINERSNKLKITADYTDSMTGGKFIIKNITDEEYGDVKAIREVVLRQNALDEGVDIYSYGELKSNIESGNYKYETVESLDIKVKNSIKTDIVDPNVTYMATTSVPTNEELAEREEEKVELATIIFDKYRNNLEITVKWDLDALGDTVGINKIISVSVPGKTASDLVEDAKQIKKTSEPADADIGGILLSPLFYFVNFIADAITGNLGNIMIGSGSLTGIGVLKNSTTPPEEGKTYHDYPVDTSWNILGNIQYPNITYTPEEIFAGNIDLLSIDFISGKDNEGNMITGDWANIRIVISQWYKVLRMIAIIGLLSVLIYTGIKIIISANAKDKAKFKEWILNWFMAVAILFFMHYVMAFIVSVTGEISKLISNSSQGIKIINGSEESVTNLMGLVRFMIQSEDFYMKIGYEVMYIALIVYTIKFTVIYLKRVLNMAFLTLIAPIVALTYPIDKINDGNAQGFNMWLREYIFNALLQPMHCILYYILLGSAIGIAASNPIYGIVVLMFMTEAEKLLKKIFGFDKAGGGTVGGMAGAFAAGAIASNVKNLAKLAKGGNAGKGGAGGSDQQNSYLDNVKPEKEGSIEDNFSNDLLDDNISQSQETNENPESNMPESNTPESNMQTPNPQAFNTSESDTSSSDTETQGTEDTNDEKGNAVDDEEIQSPDNGEPIKQKRGGVVGGLKNVGKTLIKPVYDVDRKGEGYNKQRWKRRGVKALKGLGKATVGATIGTAAAAVQAGISITDGKYNPMEGFATFSAGFAGGSGLASRVGGKLANSFKEGYYEGDNNSLIKKQQEEFKYNDKVDKEYKRKYDDEYMKKHKYGKGPNELKQLASELMLPYGYKEPKEQFAIQKMADNIFDNKKGVENYSAEQKDELMKKAIIQSRATKGFVDDLEKQGLKSIIKDPDKQHKYTESILKARNISADSDEGKKIIQSYDNAFKLAARWQDINS